MSQSDQRQPQDYRLSPAAHARLIEARDSLRLLDSYVNKTDVLCNPSLLAGYVSMLQSAVQEVISDCTPAAPTDSPQRCTDQPLDAKERALIDLLRGTCLEGREDICQMAERIRRLKPWGLKD